MQRTLRFAVAVVSLMGLASQGRAQVPVSGPGGFGSDYVQAVPSHRYLLDRGWMVTESPAGGAMPPAARTAQAPVGLVGQVSATARRAGARRSSARARAERAYSLPTGSLAWPGAGSVPLYSPAQRHESYDAGYGRSPYGSINY